MYICDPFRHLLSMKEREKECDRLRAERDANILKRRAAEVERDAARRNESEPTDQAIKNSATYKRLEEKFNSEREGKKKLWGFTKETDKEKEQRLGILAEYGDQEPEPSPESQPEAGDEGYESENEDR